MKKRDWMEWMKRAGIRALKTMVQAANWGTVAGTAALAGVVSLLTSLKGLPELEIRE